MGSYIKYLKRDEGVGESQIPSLPLPNCMTSHEYSRSFFWPVDCLKTQQDRALEHSEKSDFQFRGSDGVNACLSIAQLIASSPEPV